MPTRDFGTVMAFVGDGVVDVTFPKGYDAVRSALGAMKGRWNPERRCWTVEPARARLTGDEAADRIEAALMEAAPPGWSEAVARFGGFACASRKYEVKVGAGGLRVTLPQGHPSDWVLKKVDGGKLEAGSWLLPARSCANPEIAKVLQRVVAEDRKTFVAVVEDWEGRSIHGTAQGTHDNPTALGIEVGRVVYADHAFVRVADPQVHNGPIHAWPFRVLAAGEAEDGLELRLGYLDPDTAYRAVRHRMARPPEERTALLDMPHAGGKWGYKRA